jgi:hypothetical protein
MKTFNFKIVEDRTIGGLELGHTVPITLTLSTRRFLGGSQ